ncbi:MAG: aldose epimerase family protein, partial [Rikenellaceae bacterium]
TISCGRKQLPINVYPASSFTTTIDGKNVSLYTLKNKDGLTLQVTNFGARVIALWTPDRNGKFTDIVLGYGDIDRYVRNRGERFLGATIGRYGNRIAKGEFKIDTTTYHLAQNNNGQCLHGGLKSFDMVVWNVDKVTEDEVAFSYLSPDMEEGFPGNLSVKMIYSLTPDNEFKITYSATTDKPTPVNLTHHSFFNLKGEGSGTINNHELQIFADKFIPIDSVMIPLGIIQNIEGTSLDFRTPHTIGARINDSFEQLKLAKGYDHCYVLNRKTPSDVELAAVVYEPQSGRQMEVFTTEPAIQFYGGNFFDGKSLGKNGTPYNFRETFALETQHFPDSPNQPSFPSTILNPGQTYSQTCIYKFGVRK